MNYFYKKTTKKQLYYIAFNLAMRVNEDKEDEALKTMALEKEFVKALYEKED